MTGHLLDLGSSGRDLVTIWWPGTASRSCRGAQPTGRWAARRSARGPLSLRH